VILFLINGQLPWHEGVQKLRGQDRLNFVINMKKELKIEQYGHKVPRSIVKAYRYVRKLKFEEKPDYKLLKYFIKKDVEDNGGTLDWQFDWSDEVSQHDSGRSSMMRQSAYDVINSMYVREYDRDSVESDEQEDYFDFPSDEMEEGVNIDMKEMSPKKNNLHQLVPSSETHGSSLPNFNLKPHF